MTCSSGRRLPSSEAIVAERAPLSITYYLSGNDAELFASLFPLRTGGPYDEREHDALIERGLAERDEWGRQLDGTYQLDVRLTNKGERELARLRAKAAAEFESKRRERRAVAVPSSPALDPSRRSSVPASRHPGRGFPAGRASRPVPDSEHVSRESLASEHEEGA